MTREQIRDIAENLDCGFKCIVHKKTNEIKFIPDVHRLPGIDSDAWSDEEKEIQKHAAEYVTITGMNSKDTFQLMADFSEEVDDQNVKAKLNQALEGPNPFRNFKYQIENSGSTRNDWLKFKEKRMQTWVENKLQEIESS